MKEVATREDFEKLSSVLLDFAQHTLSQGDELSPVIAVMPTSPDGDVGPERPVRTIGFMPVGALQTEEAGGAGKDFIAHMLQTLAQAPEVQVVGYLSEAWMSQATKGANVTNRTECVIITLMSADCQALQICPIGRNEDTVNVTVTEMQFDRPENPLQGRFVRPRHVN